MSIFVWIYEIGYDIIISHKVENVKKFQYIYGGIAMKKLSAIIIGYGNRGQTYAKYAIDHPDELEIKAVADPVSNKLEYVKKHHNLNNDMLFCDWKELTSLPKFADFAIIATQDDMHYEPTLECIEKGYNILLEKPISPSPKECKEIAEAAEKKGVKIIVCHVLRYTNFYCTLKDIIDSEKLGKIMSVDAVEAVGNIHQSHSFVRGNWRNSKESAPMILAKSCHDTDIIQWLIGSECKKVHSFGSLSYFTKDNKPEGAPDYCIKGCPKADECYYNAVKLYYDDKENDWFRTVAANTSENPSDERVMEAITNGPYGRCVFDCDNDVVDHQVVTMEFKNGCTVTFSMNAFNEGGRYIRLFGTKGELTGSIDTGEITIYTFDTKETQKINLNDKGNDITNGHGGGDTGIMIALLNHFNDVDPGKSVSSVRTSYLNHLISFAAEHSRITGEVVDIDNFSKNL